MNWQFPSLYVSNRQLMTPNSGYRSRSHQSVHAHNTMQSIDRWISWICFWASTHISSLTALSIKGFIKDSPILWGFSDLVINFEISNDSANIYSDKACRVPLGPSLILFRLINSSKNSGGPARERSGWTVPTSSALNHH